MRKFTVLASILASAGFATPALAAGTDSDTMLVTATVVDTCVVTASPMAFATLTTLGTANIDTSATINLACTPNALYEVSMDMGLTGVGGQRRLVNGLDASQTIPYGIYLDAARTNPWAAGSGETIVANATGGTATLTAYGRIPNTATAVTAGSYADTVTVTVGF